MFCIIIVFPAFGGATIKPLCPLPMGETKSMILPVRSSDDPLPASKTSGSSGNKGVRFENNILLRTFSGAS